MHPAPHHRRSASQHALSGWVEQAYLKGVAAAPRGKVTGQIPELSGVDPSLFALTVTTVDGAEASIGDAHRPFSLQSLTKLYSLWLLLEREPTAWEQVGWGPSEASYGSVAVLEQDRGRPRNPFVNAGALVVTDRLLRHAGDVPGAVGRFLSERSGEEVLIDKAVAGSESSSDHRNRAIAHVLAEYGRLINPVETVLDQYHQQCALTASVTGVARASLFLADRQHPTRDATDPDARRVNAVLLTSGMYGAAGDIAYRVGLPAKSGIGGGVLAVMPGIGTICAWSPPLDEMGNSRGGVEAIEEFARLAGWSVF